MTRPNSPTMDAELGREHPVLNKGFVRVVDYMGNDAAIVQAARVSYGAGTKTPSDDRSLIRYLMSHRHSTPFEMCEIKLHVKLPIFVARQWIRHRTANVNEYSARYSILDKEFYFPELKDLKPQSVSNAQGREGELSLDTREDMLAAIRVTSEDCYDRYEELSDPDREGGLARELSRMVLPSNIYTQWYWKVDLHNLFHFLSLRADPHAQWEIRAYAEIILDLVAQWVPQAHEAFEDYVMGAERFSRMEMEALRSMIATTDFAKDGVVVAEGMNTREAREFAAKLGMT